MKLDRTLIDKEGVPTLDEFREFFHKHDITTVPPKTDICRMDESSRAIYLHIKGIIDTEWDFVGREMGLKQKLSQYSKTYSLRMLRDNVTAHITEMVMGILQNPALAADLICLNLEENTSDTPDLAAEALTDTEGAAFIHNPDELLSNMIRWYGTRRKFETVSTESHIRKDENGKPLESTAADPRVNTEREVLAEMTRQEFFSSLSDDEETLLDMLLDGKTQQEIADALGYKTHSSVTKRVAKLRDKYRRLTGM
jgi:hypothetical protein